MPTTFLRRLAATCAVLAATVLAAPAAQAQSSIYQQSALTTASPLVTFTFSVATAGTFRIYTQAPTIDPQVHLFSGTDLQAPGAYLGSNDDGCPNALCGSAGSWYNGLIMTNLDVGTYTAVGTQCCYAPSGFATATYSGDPASFRIVVDSDQGVAMATSTVPEPGTWALMGTGLLGVAAAARRRRTA